MRPYPRAVNTKIMGILNVTPDSFSDGGRLDTVEAAVRTARQMVAEGASVLDVGGESTRPGAEEVAVEEELRRVVPAIDAIRRAFRDEDEEPLISVDTRKPEVARAAVHAGADIWNDVSALTFSERSVDVAAELGCAVILMHSLNLGMAGGTPDYTDPVADIRAFLAERMTACRKAGIDHITLDPGIGFGKRLEHNLAILANVSAFAIDGVPVLIGASRKSFIGKLDGSAVEERLGGSIATALLAAQSGASVVRVHDVLETKQALVVAEAVSGASGR